jgi:hypothetical protein
MRRHYFGVLFVGSNSFALLAGAKTRQRRCSRVHIKEPQRLRRSKEPELRILNKSHVTLDDTKNYRLRNRAAWRGDHFFDSVAHFAFTFLIPVVRQAGEITWRTDGKFA